MEANRDEMRGSCPKCGAALHDGDTFCAACGHALQPSPRCPQCDAPVRKGARFCFKCGAGLPPPAGVAETAAAPRASEQKAALITPPPIRATQDTSPRVEPVLVRPPAEDGSTSRVEPAIASAVISQEAAASPEIAVMRRNRGRAADGHRKRDEASPRAPDPIAASNPRSNAFRTIWPVAVVAGVSLLAAGMFWMFTGPDADAKKAVDTSKATAKRPGAKPALASRPADPIAASQGFSVKNAFQTLYGSYDPNLDGAFWTAKGPPRNFAQWNGKTLLIRPLVSKTFSEGDNLRHVLVTNALDTKDGMVVKQGTGCPTCGSLIGAAIFEKQGNEWKVISRHDFLAADGAFGAPPKVSVDFPPDGGIQLTFKRSDLLDRDAEERSYAIVLKERKGVKSAMR